jgi:hypothetical protein
MNAALLDRPRGGAGVATGEGSATRPVRVAIAAPTVGRPDGLRRLLQGLAGLTFTRIAEPEITVIVIDNDATPTALPIVESFRPLLRWPLVYRHEPRRGLVFARNAQLDSAPADADWLAMIDDDEVPVPEWLDALLATALARQAQFVAGPVLPAFVGDAPRWAREGGFFEVGPLEDGADMTCLYTGNVLMALGPVRAAGWRFDMSFNHSGGEDEQFFTRALRSGAKAVAAADARIFETIPPARATPRWVLRRYFRMGTTLAAIDLMEDPSPRTRLVRGLKGAARLLLGIVGLSGVVRNGSVAVMKGVSDIARGAGAIVGVFGVRYGEYRPGDRHS